MATAIHIQANTEVLGLYQKQKAEFHFQEKTDNEFLMFLLDTAVRVISIVQHLAPVIEAVSDASADVTEDLADDENFDSDFPNAESTSTMEIDRINREVEDIIQLPPEPAPPLLQQTHQRAQLVSKAALISNTTQDSQFRHQQSRPLPVPIQIPVASSQISPPTSQVSQLPVSQMSTSQMSVPVQQLSAPPQYSAHIPSSSVPVSLSVSDIPAASHPAPAPQSTSQPTSSSDTRDTSFNQFTAAPSAHDTRDTPFNQFTAAPSAHDAEESNSLEEFKAETVVPEVVTIKDEPMFVSSDSSSALLPQDTLHHLMNTLQSNEENIGVSNLVTTAHPSTFFDKANNPLSMLTLSNTANNASNLFPGDDDSIPGSSRGGQLKSLMDSKAGSSGAANPRHDYEKSTALAVIRKTCDICHKEVLDVKRHKNLVHYKIKPFSCSYCNKYFGTSYNRNSHEKKKHEKKTSSFVICTWK